MVIETLKIKPCHYIKCWWNQYKFHPWHTRRIGDVAYQRNFTTLYAAAAAVAASMTTTDGYASVMRSTTSSLDVHGTYLGPTDTPTMLSNNIDSSASRAYNDDKHYVGSRLAGTPNKAYDDRPTITDEPMSMIIQPIND